MSDVDVIVVGMGVGGEEVAGRLAESGLSVLGVENNLVGGECPYWACVPSKMMIRAADLVADARRLDGLGGSAEVRTDWSQVAARIRRDATDDWNDQAAVDRFTGKGGTFLRGSGRITGPGRVEVDGEEHRARRAIVLGTGSAPTVPPIDGLAGTPYWTNREAIEATAVPSSLIVLGGGAIGVELSQVFARFGAAVTIVEAADRILPSEEPEASTVVADALSGEGVDLVTGRRAVRVGHDGGEFTLGLDDGGEVRAERLLVAVGRTARTDDLGLDAVGVRAEGKGVEVDGHMKAADGVWAVGDVTGKGQFTHVAMYQAGIVVRSILGEPGPPADYRSLPRVTFADPEVGAVGLTERQAREAGLDVVTGIAEIAQSTRGWIFAKGNEGIVKLVVDRDRDLLVGGTVAAPAGGETMGALAVAVYGEVPVSSLRHMMYAYPTFYRAIEAALADVG